MATTDNPREMNIIIITRDMNPYYKLIKRNLGYQPDKKLIFGESSRASN